MDKTAAVFAEVNNYLRNNMKPRRMDSGLCGSLDDTYFRMCTCAQVHSWRVFGDSLFTNAPLCICTKMKG